MRFHRTTRILQGQWNAVPFLCVLFPLSFFLIFGSQLVLPPGVAVELPTSSTGVRLDASRPRLVLALDVHGRVYLDNLYVPRGEVTARLRDRKGRLSEEPVVLVHADVGVPHGEVMQLGELVRKAGLDRIFFMARPTR